MWAGEDYKPITREEVIAHVSPGWATIVDELLNDLDELGWNKHVLDIRKDPIQGYLLFATRTNKKEVLDRISLALLQSLVTCEICGKEAKEVNIYEHKYILCEKHQ